MSTFFKGGGGGVIGHEGLEVILNPKVILILRCSRIFLGGGGSHRGYFKHKGYINPLRYLLLMCNKKVINDFWKYLH